MKGVKLKVIRSENVHEILISSLEKFECEKTKSTKLYISFQETHSDSEYEITITEQNWRNDSFTQLGIFALAFSASNLFRFPYDCYNYGGSKYKIH